MTVRRVVGLDGVRWVRTALGGSGLGKVGIVLAITSCLVRVKRFAPALYSRLGTHKSRVVSRRGSSR